MSGPEYIASVHRFLKKLKIPDAKMEKIIGMTVIANSKQPLKSRAKNNEELTDLDCIHTMLIELDRKSGRHNYLTVIIRPKNDRDSKEDGKPYVMKADMLGEEEWTTDDESDDDETVYGPDNYDRFNTSDITDDEDDKDGDKAVDKAANNANDKAGNKVNDNGEDTAEDTADELANDTADETADEAGDEDVDEGTDEEDEQADDEDDEQTDDEEDDVGDDEDDDQFPDRLDSASEDHAYYTADDTVESDN